MRQTHHHPEPHGHAEHPDPILRPKALKRLKITLFIAASLFVVELVGGWISGSLSLMADAFHVLGDCLALSVTLLASWLAERPQSPRRSFGYYRLEVLAALLNGIFLIAIGVFILIEAYHRWQSPHEITSALMLKIAIFGLIVNVIMLFILKPAHDHNLNLRGAYLHLIGDSLSSVAVVISAVLISTTGWVALDSIASAFVSLMIISMAFRLSWDSIHVLLEGTPKHMDPEEIERAIKKQFPQIVSIHDFHIWEITAHLFAMTAHVEAKVGSHAETKLLIDGMNALIKENYGIGHTTFQVEPSD